MTLAAGLRQLERQVAYMVGHGEEVGLEAPQRIHSRSLDYGEDPAMGRPLEVRSRSFGHGAIERSSVDPMHDGLGSPAFSMDFMRWLRDAGACIDCEGGEHRFPCSMVTARFRNSANRSNPRRLKRAFRQLRDIDPPAYDITWLLIARHMPWSEAVERINSSRYVRGQDGYTDFEMTAFTISGMSLLAAAF